MRRGIAQRIGRRTAFTIALVCLLIGAQAGTDLLVKPKPAQTGGLKKSDTVVKATATATSLDADGKQTVSVALDIEKGWHVYANPLPKDFSGVPTTIIVTAKTKLEEVKIDYPAGKVMQFPNGDEYKAYEDKLTIPVAVRRAKGDTSPLQVTVKFQACTDKKCLLPATVQLTVP